MDRFLAWLNKRLAPVMNLLRLLWLIGWCMTMFTVGTVFFLMNDQGLDFLRRLVEPQGRQGFWPNLFFLLSVLSWALSTWYCSRLLLTRSFPLTDRKFFDHTTGLRTWIPRIGGSMVPFVIAGGFLRAPREESGLSAAHLWAGFYCILGIALLAALWKRRTLFSTKMRGSEPYEVLESLPSAAWRTLAVSFGLSTGLLVLFPLFPVNVATTLGSPAILLFAAASWILFGSMILTYWPLANGYPSLTLPLILAALVMSGWNDNHTIRSTKVQANSAPRETPERHFRRWLTARLEHSNADRPYPVFVVASAGGGIRAAYWTASVLGRIADESPVAWPNHLYAISGVSGGSVGSAMHAVQIAELLGRRQERPADVSTNFVAGVRRSLDNDILSPVLAYLLYPDLIQRFLPIPFSFADRSKAIELALETATADREGVNSYRFARRFVELWPEKEPCRTPVLLLNTTVVETGQRAIVSNLKIDNTFADAVDLLGSELHTQNMPLSTAAHLSARFTYVSPAGTIRTTGGNVWGHIVDGGYFENSGAATAAELLQRMHDVADAVEMETARRVSFMLVLIRNDPDAPIVCGPQTAGTPPPKPAADLSELLSPVRTLLSTRIARGRLAEEAALRLVHGFHGTPNSIQSPHCENGCVFEFSLTGTTDPPLGWSLSAHARKEMDELLEKQNTRFACIRGLLTGEGCDMEPVCVPGR